VRLRRAQRPAPGAHAERVAVRAHRFVREEPLHVRREFLRARVPVGRRFVQTLQDHRFERLRYVANRGGRARGRNRAHQFEKVFQRGGAKRRRAGGDLVQHRAEAVHVGALVDLVERARGLLRGHVSGGSQHLPVARRAHAVAGVRDTRGRVAGRVRVRGFGFAEHFRDAPIEQNHFAEVAEDHVRRFQVAVNDAPRVCVGDRLAQRDERGEQFAQVERAGGAARAALVVAGDGFAERAPAHEPHGVERRAGVVAREFVHGHDAGVFELPGDAGLAHEPRRRGRQPAALGKQFLERHFAVHAGVVREPHAAQAAGRVQARDGIAVAAAAGERLRQQHGTGRPGVGRRAGARGVRVRRLRTSVGRRRVVGIGHGRAPRVGVSIPAPARRTTPGPRPSWPHGHAPEPIRWRGLSHNRLACGRDGRGPGNARLDFARNAATVSLTRILGAEPVRTARIIPVVVIITTG
jgi:hypothetical protein